MPTWIYGVFLTIAIGLGGWIVYTIDSQSDTIQEQQIILQKQDKEIGDLRSSIVAVQQAQADIEEYRKKDQEITALIAEYMADVNKIGRSGDRKIFNDPIVVARLNRLQQLIKESTAGRDESSDSGNE